LQFGFLQLGFEVCDVIRCYVTGLIIDQAVMCLLQLSNSAATRWDICVQTSQKRGR